MSKAEQLKQLSNRLARLTRQANRLTDPRDADVLASVKAEMLDVGRRFDALFEVSGED